MKKLLITGGCGLIGSASAEHFHGLGYEVVVADNLERASLLGKVVSDRQKYFRARKLQELGIQWTMSDVSSAEAWGKIDQTYGRFDAVIHTAGQTSVPNSVSNPVRDFEVNCLGTFLMLEKARKWGARVVMCSTNKTFDPPEAWHQEDGRWRWTRPDWHQHGYPCEKADFGPLTIYGTSKRAGDIYCQNYWHSFGVPTFVARMSCIYGDQVLPASEQGWMSHFARQTLKHEPIEIYGDLGIVRDVLHVDDLVRLYEAYLLGPIEHGVYCVGGGPDNTVSLGECLDILESFTGLRSKVSFHPRRHADHNVWTSDIRPLAKGFNWRPRITPAEGLKRVVQFITRHPELF